MDLQDKNFEYANVTSYGDIDGDIKKQAIEEIKRGINPISIKIGCMIHSCYWYQTEHKVFLYDGFKPEWLIL